LTGGNEDVSPLLYGENPVKEVTCISQERDNFEISLVRRAFDRKMPVLAICRGMQLMNVAMGGSLYQDVFSQVPGCLGHYPESQPVDTLYHEVRLEKDSMVSKVFGAETIRVNSFHHQAVKTLADGFKPTAYSADGIVEAMEYQGDVRAIGVQWHPEDLTVNYPEFLGLFKVL
ncbi:MAG: gamma-glutamyl-gamma-aminobutyrate hydrolase family protein, partial [Desulfobacterales bacterium]|nr:gamma-glutamyl-gamma-aminobutyrate hydrolase family protein [Desulfobacterales bacterium]